MRKFSVLLSILVLAAMILAACGGEETSTSIPTENVPSVTVESTDTSGASSATATEISTATEVPTEGVTTETPGIPVTGAANSELLSKVLHFTVSDQSGKQVGKVDDLVLNLSKAKVLYVVVNAEGKKIPVPWAFFRVGPASASSYPNEQQMAFTLQADTNTLKNAPVLDLKNVPELGVDPDSWDISFRKYWEGSSGATSGSNTPSPAGTAVTDMTATATSTSNSAGNATSTPAASLGTSQGTETEGAISIQGVQLASKVLGAKLTVAVTSLSLSTSTPSASIGLATSTPGTGGGGTGLATSTPSAGGASLATSTPGANTGLVTSTPSTSISTKKLSASIDDLIVNIDSGDIMYIVLKTNFEDGEHLIPVPLHLLQWDAENKAFLLNIEAAMLQNAPFFQKNQFPDLTMPGWNSEFDSFWQNDASGTGAQATATP